VMQEKGHRVNHILQNFKYTAAADIFFNVAIS
jgi:hypothetical protein